MNTFVKKARFILMTGLLTGMFLTSTIYGETLRILTWESYISSEHRA